MIGPWNLWGLFGLADSITKLSDAGNALYQEGKRAQAEADKYKDMFNIVGRDLIDARKRVRELEDAIRSHRDAKADDRCWMDDQDLYKVLNDGNLGDNTIPDPEKMLENCKRFIAVRCKGGAWPSYQELEADIEAVKQGLRVEFNGLDSGDVVADFGTFLSHHKKKEEELAKFKASNEMWFLEAKKAYAEKHEALAALQNLKA